MQYLNNTAVSEEMYQKARAIKDKGGKVFLVIPEILDSKDWQYHKTAEFCSNCNGAGKLGLQVITGGPYRNYVPPTEFKGWNPKKKKDDPGPRATWIDGDWYLQKTREFTCPDCHGTGSAPEDREPTKRLVF